MHIDQFTVLSRLFRVGTLNLVVLFMRASFREGRQQDEVQSCFQCVPWSRVEVNLLYFLYTKLSSD